MAALHKDCTYQYEAYTNNLHHIQRFYRQPEYSELIEQY